MEAIIAHFRGSRDIKTGNHMILHIAGVDNREKAKKLVGKSVSWQAPGKNKTTIKGKIAAPHGNTGAVRTIFERGLPGQCLGERAVIE